MAYAGAILASAIALVVFILLAMKYEVGKARTVRHLRDMVGFLVLDAAIDYVVFTVNGLNPDWREVFDYVALSSYASFTMNAVANIFLLLFIRDVFFDGKNWWFVKLLAVLEASVGPPLVIIFFTGDDYAREGRNLSIMQILLDLLEHRKSPSTSERLQVIAGKMNGRDYWVPTTSFSRNSRAFALISVALTLYLALAILVSMASRWIEFIAQKGT